MLQELGNLEALLHLKSKASAEIVDVNEALVKLVIFELGGSCYAFYSEAVREILSQAEIFFVPGCPPSLKGVINVRGDIESVISLADLLGKVLNDSSTTILLAEGSGIRSGILVDKILDVLDVVQSSIHPPPDTLPENMRPIVSGLIHYHGIVVVILDLNRLFKDYASGLT